MKKLKIFSSVIAVMVVMIFSMVSVNAIDQKVYDYADLLTHSEENDIQELAKKTADKINMDIVILTTEEDVPKTAEISAEEFYDDNGFGYGDYKDGVLLYVNMNTRDYWICTTGNMRKYLDDKNLENVDDDVQNCLHQGNYYDGFKDFIDNIEYYYDRGIPNTQYIFDPESGQNIKNPDYFPISMEEILCFIGVALVIAVIAVIIVLYRYKNNLAPSAQAYIDNKNYNLRVKTDTFIREYTTSHKIETSSSSGGGGFSGGSSGGSSHGGCGGKF